MPLKDIVFELFDENDQIAGRTSPRPDIPLAFQCNIIAARHARRDLDLDALAPPAPSISTAVRAGIGDDAPLAPAARTGGYVDELSEERPGDLPYLAGAATGRTGLSVRSALCAGSSADGACCKLGYFYLLFGAYCDFVE